jgi:hypothetical protein
MIPDRRHHGEEIRPGPATKGAQFAGVMPPMATHGTVMISLHQRRISMSGRALASLVWVGKKAPKAT